MMQVFKCLVEGRLLSDLGNVDAFFDDILCCVFGFLFSFLLCFCFGATPGSALRLLLAQCSGMALGGASGILW